MSATSIPSNGKFFANTPGRDDAPGARACHPREEHLIPLLLAAGAAGEDSGQRDYSDRVMGKALSGFRFG